MRRVIYGPSWSHMGSVSKWNVPGDDICRTMPEVFAPSPKAVSGYG